MPSTHVIVSTHTTRHLRATLHGVVRQTTPPATIVVTCDTDDAAIAELVAQCSRDFHAEFLLVQRPHTGDSRSSQVRNNGVRALLGLTPASTLADDRLWFLDGDCLPAPDALAQHARLASRPASVVIGFRVDLTPEQTEHLRTEATDEQRAPVDPAPEQWRGLQARHRRYQRAAFLRRLGLGKPHKPKLLSANFSVSLEDYQKINGFDEQYIGYGQEDDDLGRRLYAAGVKPVVGVAHAVVFHQFHPTRAPQAWDKAPNVERFRRAFQIRCQRGLEHPLEQPAVRVTRVREGAEVRVSPGVRGGAGSAA